MTSFPLISKPSVIDRLWYFSNDTWTINGSRENSGHSLKGKLCEEPPLSTYSLCVFCTDSDCCVENTLLPPFDEPDDFCVCEFGGLGSFGLKIHPCSCSYFLLVCIFDIVLDVRHCTLCCPGLAVVFTLSIVPICYLKYLNGCASVWNNSKFHHLLNRFGRHGKLQLITWHYVLETWGGGND